MTETHVLKCDPGVFQMSWDGVKLFEIRLHDRKFNVLDNIILKETRYPGTEMKEGAPLIYTGREIHQTITCMVAAYGMQPGWVILGVKNINRCNLQ